MSSVGRRLNVINKIVIPRTKASVKYIQLELEEVAREELHRIKKIQAFKKKKREGKKSGRRDKQSPCPICLQPISEEKEVRIKKPVTAPRPPSVPTPPLKQLPAPAPAPTPPPPAPTPARPALTVKISVPTTEKPSELIAVHEPTTESRKEIFRPICDKDVKKPCGVTRALSPISHLSLGDYSGVSKLEHLKEMLDTTISLGQDVADTDAGSIKMDEVLKLCKEAKLKLDLSGGGKPEPGSRLATELEHLKLHIREIIEVTRGLRDVTFLSPSLENFVQTCEQVDDKLKIAIKNVETGELSEDAKNHLLDLKDEINDVLQVISTYRKEDLLTQSVEDFEKVCTETKAKIACYTKEGGLSANEEKLEHLKSHVGTLETLTTDVKRDGVRSASLEKFLASCKDFKQKIEYYKARDRQSPGKQIGRLISQIGEAIKSSQAAKSDGLVSSNLDKFLKSCENFKTRLETKSKESQTPLNKLKSDIDEVIDLINNLQMQGLISESTANFLKTCEETKYKLDFETTCPQSYSILSPECGKLCTCQSDEVHEICDKCKNMYDEPEDDDSVTIELPPPCNTCRGAVPEIPCSDCNAPPDESDCRECTSRVTLAQKPNSCSSCNAAPPEPEPEPVKPVCEPTDDDEEEYGIFEKKVKTITKITRYKTETGDIKEEKEVTTIKRVKHDPHETDIDCDELESDESFDVGMCIAPTQNQMGFRNMAKKCKSEQVMRVSSLNRPHFRHCVSFNPQVCYVRPPSLNLFANDSGQLSSTTSLCIFQTSFM